MKKCRLLLAAGLLMFLTGCFSQSVEEFYAPPKAPDDYLKLDNEINKVLTQGGEYAAPLSGELTQKVQLQDLDGDGVQEAIAFFRVSADERPLKIYIYRQVGENYEVAAVIEGSGNAIDSIYYENLDDSPSKELIVDWETAGQRHSLAAYSIDRYEVLELMRTDHAGFQIYDVDGDGQKEILVLQMAAGEVGQAESFVNSAPGSRVEVYNFRDGILELDASAPLSNGVEKLVSMKTGYLQNMAPALFVTSTYAENGQITDIFAWKNGGLENVTLEPDTGESDSTIRWSTEVESTKESYTDINHDGILAGGGERAVIFSYWEGSADTAPVPFLVIYKLTGDNRVMRANMADRFLLPNTGEEKETIYAARLIESGWDCGLDEEGVKANFALITSD